MHENIEKRDKKTNANNSNYNKQHLKSIDLYLYHQEFFVECLCNIFINKHT